MAFTADEFIQAGLLSESSRDFIEFSDILEDLAEKPPGGLTPHVVVTRLPQQVSSPPELQHAVPPHGRGSGQAEKKQANREHQRRHRERKRVILLFLLSKSPELPPLPTHE